MPESARMCTEPNWWRQGRLATVAVLLTFILTASPSASADCDDWNTTSFFASGTASDVRACLAAGADPMARGEGDFTPLHFAATLTDGSRIVEALLDAGADPMARALHGFTPLHTAAMWLGDPVGMTQLLEAGADPNVRTVDGITPLHAIGLEAKEVSPVHGAVWDRLPEWLADRIADWMAPDSHAAAIMALLLEAGADPMARTVDGATPLHFVSFSTSDPKIVEALVDAGGDPSARAEGGTTPLHYAVGFARNLSMIEALLEAGADSNARTDDGVSLLHAAVTRYPSRLARNVTMMRIVERLEWRKLADYPGIVEVLLAAGADPSARDSDGATVLHLAAVYTIDPAIAVMLLEAGSEVDARDHADHTPLHFAAVNSVNPAIIETLIDAGADVTSRTAKDEKTALHLAAAYNANAAIIDALIGAGADVGAHAVGNMTALHLAALIGAPGVVEALIGAGADVAALTEHNETTALHFAAAFNIDPAVIDVLIDAGADPLELNGDGENAWDLARRNDSLRGTAVYERLRALVGE